MGKTYRTPFGGVTFGPPILNEAARAALIAKGQPEVIIIHGNVVDGLRFVGPFDSMEAAEEYARLSTTLRDEPWNVAYLNPPLED